MTQPKPLGFLARVTCKQCGATTLVEHTDFQGAITCNCCTVNHDHDENANSCSGVDANHEGVPCAEPTGTENCNMLTPLGEDCPGGHCGPDVDGCTVCRPITIDLLRLAPLNMA